MANYYPLSARKGRADEKEPDYFPGICTKQVFVIFCFVEEYGSYTYIYYRVGSGGLGAEAPPPLQLIKLLAIFLFTSLVV